MSTDGVKIEAYWFSPDFPEERIEPYINIAKHAFLYSKDFPPGSVLMIHDPRRFKGLTRYVKGNDGRLYDFNNDRTNWSPAIIAKHKTLGGYVLGPT